LLANPAGRVVEIQFCGEWKMEDAVAVQRLRWECDLQNYKQLRDYGMPPSDFWMEVALRQIERSKDE